MREIIVDLPAFGNPTSPTSASSFRWSRRSFSSPGKPGWDLRGARLVDVANVALPCPPSPPFAISTRWPSSVRSATCTSSPSSCALVDDRADRHLELDVLPVLAGAVGAFAVGAAAGLEDLLEAEIQEGVEVGVGDEVDRAAGPAVAAIGPPRGTNFSRRKLMAPRPPWPAATWISTSSTNIRSQSSVQPASRLLSGYSAAGGTMLIVRPLGAVIRELDRAVDLRKQRVVLAEADVQTGTEPPAALADEDRSAGDEVAVVALDAQALRVAVAPVT